MTVSAETKLSPSPPALVDRRKTNMLESWLNSATSTFRASKLLFPSKRLYLYFFSIKTSSIKSNTEVNVLNNKIYNQLFFKL